MERELEQLRRVAKEAKEQALVERRRVEAAEAQALNERRRREAAEAQALDERRRRKEIEKQVAPTDYRTYLHLCHHELFLTLKVQKDPSLSATGKYTRVDGKYYPLCLKPWSEFPSLHDERQDDLESIFDGEKLFPPSLGIDMIKNDFLSDDPVADEADMREFQFVAVQGCMKKVLVQYLAAMRAKQSTLTTLEARERASALPLNAFFRTTPYGLFVADSEGQDQCDDDTPAYKPAMSAAQQRDGDSRGRPAGDGPPPAKRVSSPTRPKLYPDQWFVRTDNDGSTVPVFVVEYKAAHKLPVGMIRTALGESQGEGNQEEGLFSIVIREVHRNKIDLDPGLRAAANARKATALVLAQAFHYMIEFGLQYSYVTSGEALVLLHVDREDPRTLYYHLAVPREEVSMDDGRDDLRRAAVPLVSTMALLSLDTTALTQGWKRSAQAELKKWPEPYEGMYLGSEESGSGDERGGGLRSIPHLPFPTDGEECREPAKPGPRKPRDEDDGDGDFDPTGSAPMTAPSSRTRYPTRSAPRAASSRGEHDGGSGGGKSAGAQRAVQERPTQYCTQSCLLGLRNGGLLDGHCPNVRFHSRGSQQRHALSAVEFARLLRQQLAEDMDEDCEALDKFGKFGAIGMLFRLVLRDYGYCIVAKGVQRPHAPRLKREEHVYESLRDRQGELIPVCLGIIEVVHEYCSSTGAHISHMMLLSYCGEPVFKTRARPLPSNLESMVRRAWTQLQTLGVEHGDERAPNVVWNAALQRVMCIDFDWAEIRTKRGMDDDDQMGLASPKRHRVTVATAT